MPIIGPQMPSRSSRSPSRSNSASSRSSSSSSSSRSPSPSESEAPPRRVVAGPELPSNFIRPRSSSCSRSGSCSDEEGPSVGPALPSVSSSENHGLSHGTQVFLEREARKKAAEQEARMAAEKAANSRPEWMLLPPSLSNASSLQAVAGDPLNLKSRGFAQSTPRVSARGGGGGASTEDADMSLWTETPEERLKRMQDQVSGVRAKESCGMSDKEALERERASRRDASIAASVAEARGKKSLVEEHNERRKKEMQHKLEDQASDERRREKRRRREQDDKDHRPSSRHSHRDRDRDRDRERRHHRSSRQGESSGSHGSRHSHRHSESSDDERRRERRKRKESDRHRDMERDRDRKSTKSRKEREEQEVKEGKTAAPMIWDRETALSIGGRLMDEKKRGRMIADANALGDRFGSGTRRFL
ncbi:uncharacterized protein UTRI_04223 [Ustilago trichophora]|uniref:DUF3752 domain-containing protein n=1 Tax=Ustilago trichophora TaxID=86804 RepID=A0A5C3ESX9_9BASI|nr:uncharacterized protein UTRI_04223 [Ustilago trichophora]